MMNRRSFLSLFSSVLGFAALSSVLPGFARAEERRRGGGDAKAAPAAGGGKEIDLPNVKPGEGAAAAVNYVEDKKKITKAELKTERQGVKFEAQHCGVCGFYKKVGMKNGKEVGTCQIFPGQLVVGEGWCASWNKKA